MKDTFPEPELLEQLPVVDALDSKLRIKLSVGPRVPRNLPEIMTEDESTKPPFTRRGLLLGGYFFEEPGTLRLQLSDAVELEGQARAVPLKSTDLNSLAEKIVRQDSEYENLVLVGEARTVFSTEDASAALAEVGSAIQSGSLGNDKPFILGIITEDEKEDSQSQAFYRFKRTEKGVVAEPLE